MKKIIVTGIGTDVGKTIASAILATSLKGDYWKPIQCGQEEGCDTNTMSHYLGPAKHEIYPPSYSFRYPLSPHHSSRLEGVVIDTRKINPPDTSRPLVIEMAGGLLTPLTLHENSFDLFKTWEGEWVIVSKHYLGSINHTLLTLEVLKLGGVTIKGLVFNGEPNPDSEAAILGRSGIPFLGRILPERYFDKNTIQRYASQWLPNLL